MTDQDMATLGRGARFVGPDGHTRYEVTTPASEDARGWVGVRDLDDDPAPEGTQPSVEGEGFFALTWPVYVQRIDDDTDGA